MNRIRTGTCVLAGPPPASSGPTTGALSASMARSRVGAAKFGAGGKPATRRVHHRP